ncbi:MAG TPA: hypothetical protein VKA94_11160, partial [Hyphomicrobiales bacterium]|nr:hypothetical protein [Hyphomicrobiales bacterium]
DETQYSGFAACELALAVIKRAGVSSPTHDDLYTGGVFVFIIANHISYILEARFESAATLGVMAFLASNGMSVEDASLSIDPISQTYNNMASSTANDGKYNLVVGQHVANWCNTPSEENFNKLVELYNLGRKFLG